MRTDEELKKDIVDQLYWDDRVDASKIEVAVSNGTATLSGSVPNYRVKSFAASDARMVQGVVHVNDFLQVEYPGIMPADTEISEDLNAVIASDPELDESKIDISVINGVVYLNGSVDKLWKKRLVEDHAANVLGVVDVSDELTVVPSGDWEDEAISFDIISALKRNAIDTEKIDVTVKEGTVWLNGAVPDYTTKRDTFEIARNTSGVVYVDDDNLAIA